MKLHSPANSDARISDEACRTGGDAQPCLKTSGIIIFDPQTNVIDVIITVALQDRQGFERPLCHRSAARITFVRDGTSVN